MDKDLEKIMKPKNYKNFNVSSDYLNALEAVRLYY